MSFSLPGILVGSYFPDQLVIFLIIPCVLLFWLIIQSFRRQLYADWILSSFLASVIVCLSVLNVHFNNDRTKLVSGNQHVFMAQVLELPEEKENSYQSLLKIKEADTIRLSGLKIVAYFEKSEKIKKVKPGGIIYAKGFINEVTNRGNPFEFDYKSYLARQKIFYTTYITTSNFKIEQPSNFSLSIKAERFRGKLLSILRTSLNDSQAFQVISALTLGYRKELSEQTRNYFANTGAMHVLAVSGLHVGMIFMFLSWLFSFMNRSRIGSILKFFILLLSLWFYALLTGFSPSVQRATVMFTFILIGNSLKRPTSVYNSIAASAFFLLLINPNLIWEVGFQLSYMAVLSIVFFYPRLEKIINFRSLIFKKLWQLFCVSLAAQIGTFALSIYYFNQFPVYFWLSNFVVIPAAFLILGFTFLFLIIYPLYNPAAQLVASFLTGFTKIVISALEKISNLPFSLLENLSISTMQLIILLLMISIVILFIKYKRKVYFFVSLSCILFYLGMGLFEKYSLLNQTRIINYKSDDVLIHLIDGRNNYLLTNSEGIPDDYLYENVLLKLKLVSPEIINMEDSSEITCDDLLIAGHLVQFLDHTYKFESNSGLQLIN